MIEKFNTDKIILFDGDCVLCNGFTSYIIKTDKSRKFKYISQSSDKGRGILSKKNIKDLSTIVLIDGNKLKVKSDAVLCILFYLSFPYSISVILFLIPRFIRDAVYRFVAINRYRLFGKSDSCSMHIDKNDK